MKKILMLLLCCSLLTGCNKLADRPRDATFIAPLGQPPVETVIWSPIDHDQLLVTASEIGSGSAEIYILNMSTNEKNILAHTENGDMWAETWYPDGQKALVFVSPGTSEFERSGYWLINISDHTSTALADMGRLAWAPDGKTIVMYIVDQKPQSDLIDFKLQLADTSTNEEKIIFENSGSQRLFGISWAPDSRNLVFSMGDYTSSNLYILNTATLTLTKITNSGQNDDPVWSPKGDSIAYVNSNNGSAPTIHLIRPDGTCDITIPSLYEARSPSWSPDGFRLAFLTPDGIYIIDVDKILSESRTESMCT